MYTEIVTLKSLFEILHTLVGWQNSRQPNENQNQTNVDLHARIFPRMPITVVTDQKNCFGFDYSTHCRKLLYLAMRNLDEIH